MTSGTLSGTGTVAAAMSGTGIIKASGGTLDLTGAIAASTTGLHIDSAANSVIRIDNTVGSSSKVTFDGTSGVLNLTGTAVAGSMLNGFAGTISGLVVDG